MIFRYNKKLLIRLISVIIFFITLGCTMSSNNWEISPTELLNSSIWLNVSPIDKPVTYLPLKIDTLDPKKVLLGKELFKDKHLSGDNTISCESCHSLQLGGGDRKKVSIGINGSKGTFNSPSILNSAFNFRQFWDGRVESLEEQINEPINNIKEMGTNWTEVVRKLQEDQNYPQEFQDIYQSDYNKIGNGKLIANITPEKIRDAIATYERSLITPNSPFDQYLKGDLSALNAQQKKGYEVFKAYGCISCHQGINIGGNMFQQFGIFGNYFEDTKQLQPEDLGRYNITGNEADRYVFKVPSLRNVALTSPYFHNGSVESLAETIRIMGKYQLGRILTTEDVDVLIEFLRSLTGEIPQ